MSTWKQNRDGEPGTEAKPEAPAATDADAEAPPPQVEVTSLEIDQDADVGSDPYNRTGQFCVPNFDKRDKN